MYKSSSSIQSATADILAAHGVRDVIVSPGSRNASIIEAMSASSHFRITRVVDERSAGFIGLGIASITNRPVAVVCTSGTALLNYAPALAEAYYRNIPLICVSADRPAEWIDQNDSQTMLQTGALANVVKGTYDIGRGAGEDSMWEAERLLNDAMLTALGEVKGPVHVNIHLPDCASEGMDSDSGEARIIEMLPSRRDITYNDAGRLAETISSTSKVMILCTCAAPDSGLMQALTSLSKFDNIVVLAERVSNVSVRDAVFAPEAVIGSMAEEKKCDMAPELLITIGSAPISAGLKKYLRQYSPARHWNLGYTRAVTDCYKALTLRIEADPAMVLTKIAKQMPESSVGSDYFRKWNVAYERARSLIQGYASRAPWSDFKAMGFIASQIPARWNIQLSNGTAVRYFELLSGGRYHRVDCNRGVSGIDGCTSTAVGAAMAYNDTTLLITGDMSAAYDLGGLALAREAERLKIVVLCNSGGNIFRTIRATRELTVCEPYLASMPELPLQSLAQAYGMGFYEASEEAELREAWRGFAAHTGAALLAVNTSPQISAEVYRGFFDFMSKN